MNNIQIVTDSTAYLNAIYAFENNIKVVPLTVNFSGQTTEEGFPGSFDSFFEELKTSKDFPTTSQPSVGAFVSVYNEAINSGKEVIAIVLSSKLSGTYNSASTAAKMVEPGKVLVIDSETAASNLRFLIERAHDLASKGKSSLEIYDTLNEEKKNMGIRLTVDTLEYLKKGGRLTNTQALIGSILNIKPIIGLEEGVLIPFDKVRGKSKAINMLVKDIPDTVSKIGICHISNLLEAEEIRKTLKLKFPSAEISINELGPVIGAHLGPKAIGICYKW